MDGPQQNAEALSGSKYAWLKSYINVQGPPKVVVTDWLRSYGTAMDEIGNARR